MLAYGLFAKYGRFGQLAVSLQRQRPLLLVHVIRWNLRHKHARGHLNDNILVMMWASDYTRTRVQPWCNPRDLLSRTHTCRRSYNAIERNTIGCYVAHRTGVHDRTRML
jgi:hypothetical protein